MYHAMVDGIYCDTYEENIVTKLSTTNTIGGFMIAAPIALIRSPGRIYVLITNVNHTYVLVKYILYIINMCLNKVISLSYIMPVVANQLFMLLNDVTKMLWILYKLTLWDLLVDLRPLALLQYV